MAPVFLMVLPGVVARSLFSDELAAAGTNEALPILMKRLLPPGVLGLNLAATVAACMSSLDSVFTAAASLFCLDLYRGWLRPAASPHEVGRDCAISEVCNALSAPYNHCRWSASARPSARCSRC